MKLIIVQTHRVALKSGQFVGALLQTLVIDGIAITLPEEGLEQIAVAIQKQEDIARGRVAA